MLLHLTLCVAEGQEESVPSRVGFDALDSVAVFDYARLRSAAIALEHRLDSAAQVLNNAIDSTYSLILSPAEYHQEALRLYNEFDADFLSDSVALHTAPIQLVERLHKLKDEVDWKIQLLDSFLVANEFFDPVEMKSRLTLGKISVVPELPDIPEILLHPELINVPFNHGLPDLGIGNKFPGIDKAIKTLREIAEVRSPEIGNLNTGVSQVVAIDEALLSNTTEGEAISQAIGEAEALETNLTAAPDLVVDAGNLTEQAKRSPKKFVDHLAGQEDKIRSEIESMGKLQRKYHSVTDVRYLPKRRTNPEKGKPFVERLIFGSTFHPENRDAQWTRIDIAPYAGYKFSDRFRACAGVTYRVAVDVQHFELSRHDRAYGYRAFGNYRIFNGLFAHLEVDALKTTIPAWHSRKAGLQDTGEPLWVPMAYVGIMKSYRLGRRLRGNTEMLYDFLDVSRNFDFNKVTFRFTFEFEFRRRNIEPKAY